MDQSGGNQPVVPEYDTIIHMCSAADAITAGRSLVVSLTAVVCALIYHYGLTRCCHLHLESFHVDKIKI